MIILISSKIGTADITTSLGKPEYSYYFLLREFIPALQQLGTVIEASNGVEVDALFDQHRALGQAVVFLSFSPPHQTPVDLRCPTLSVFAWEFDNVPDEPWEDDPRNDWRYVLSRNGAAITLSQESATAIRHATHADFPVLVVPAPVWSRFCGLYRAGGWLPQLEERSLSFTGIVIDSPILGLSADGLVRKPEPQPVEDAPVVVVASAATRLSWTDRLHITRTLWRDWWAEIHRPVVIATPPVVVAAAPAPELPVEVPVEAPKPAPPTQLLSLRGVVYVTVLNPGDGRKNWVDLITAFCWAFKDVADATLVVKMTHHDLEYYRVVLMTLLSRLAPFECRVLVLHGYLADSEYRELIELSDYYVNASACEGLCLPLMEFLSAGKPVLAPVHTAMSDYLNAELAFLVRSSPEPSCWSHDPTGKLRTRRYRLNWESLMEAYHTSYRVAREQPQQYQAMSLQAFEQMRDYCSLEQVGGQLQAFLENLPGLAAGALSVAVSADVEVDADAPLRSVLQ